MQSPAQVRLACLCTWFVVPLHPRHLRQSAAAGVNGYWKDAGRSSPCFDEVGAVDGSLVMAVESLAIARLLEVACNH